MTIRQRLLIALVFIGFATTLPLHLAAAPGESRILPRVAQPIVVDGKLDEAAWKDAESYLATLYLKGTDTVPGRPTKVYGACDAETIYLAWQCEEKSDEDVADRKLARDGYNLWQNDCVEVFLQTGLQPGIFYHFIADVRGQRWDGKQDVDSWNPKPDWQVASQRQGAKWQLEMAIPVACVGLKRANRGDFVKLLLAREDWTFVGAGQGAQNLDRLECWPLLKTRSFNTATSYRRFYFESDNIFGPMVESRAEPGMPQGFRRRIHKQYEPYEPAAPPKPELDPANNALTIHIPPNSVQYDLRVEAFPWHHQSQPYRWTFRAKFDEELDIWPGNNGQPRVRPKELVGTPDAEGFVPFSIVYSTEDSSRDVACIWKIVVRKHDKPRRVILRDMRLERLEGVSGLGYKCLTGNALAPSSNLKTGATLSTLRGGKDEAVTFEGHAKGRDLKLGESPLFDGDEKTQVTFNSGKTGEDRYRKGIDLIIDLKKDYFIRGARLSSRKRDINRVELSVRPESAKAFALVKNFKVAGGSFFLANIEKIDSTARWVRLRADVASGWHGKIVGFSELQVWGEPRGEHTDDEINYLLIEDGKQVANRPLPQFFSGAPIPHIYPQPQQVAYTTSEYVLPREPRIVIDPGANWRDRFTAGEIKRILKEQFGLEARILESDRVKDARGAIAVGQTGTSPIIKKLARKQKLEVPTGKNAHEGYALQVGNNGVLIAGADAGGTFYGGQAFCQLLAHNGERVTARGARVKDWPYIRFRSIQRFLPTNAPFRIDEWKRVIRGLARVRVNAMWVQPNPVTMEGSLFKRRRWGLSVEQVQALTRYAEGYNVSVLPHIALCARLNIGNDPSLYEHYPDEDPKTIYKLGRSCPCPSNPKLYEVIDQYIGDCTKLFPSKYWSVGLAHEMFHESVGSRWNVCPRCTPRKLSDRDLWADFATKVLALFEKHNRIAMIEGSTSLVRPSMIGALERVKTDWNVTVMQSYGFSSEKKVTKKYLVDAGVKRSLLWYNDAWENDYKQKEMWGDDLPWGVVYANWRERNHATWKSDNIYLEQCRGMPLHWNPLAPRGTRMQQERETIELLRQLMALSDRVNYPSRRFDVAGRFTPLDLKPACNDTTVDEKPGDLRGWLDRGPNYDLRYLPTGEQQLGGVLFRLPDPEGGQIDNCVSVNKLAVEKKTAVLPVNRRAHSIVFLHGLGRQNTRSVCHYEIEYANGTRVLAPVWGDADVRAWDVKPPDVPPTEILHETPQATWSGREEEWTPPMVAEGWPAWTGFIPCGYIATLYAWEWVNPYPGQVIRAIRIMAPAEQKEDLAFLLAATAVSVPGAREAFWLKPPQPPRHLSENVMRLAGGETFDKNDKFNLAGGKITRKDIDGGRSIYTAPDGTDILSNMHHTTVRDTFREAGMGEIYTFDDLEMEFTFPEARSVSAVVLRPKHGHPELHELRLFNIEIEVSGDGASFRSIGSALQAGPEVDGLLRFTCAEQGVKKLRLRMAPREDLRGDHYWEAPAIELLEIYR